MRQSCLTCGSSALRAHVLTCNVCRGAHQSLVAVARDILLSHRNNWTTPRTSLMVLDRLGTSPLSAPRATLREFVMARFIPEVLTPKPVTARTPFEYSLNRHLLPVLGDEQLSDISFVLVQDRIVQPMLHLGYLSQTIKEACRVLSRVFVHARNCRYFTGPSPSANIRLPKIRRTPARALSAEQVRAILRSFAEPFRTMALVAVTTSMSGAELRGLHWKHVNLTNDTLSIEGEMLPPASIAIRIFHAHGRYGAPKTYQRRRNVLLPKEALLALKRRRARTRFCNPDDLVFATSKGNPLYVSFLHGKIKEVGRRLEMPWLSWQCFRNTYATLSEECGLPLADRRAQLGLTSEWMVQHYGAADMKVRRAGSNAIAERIT